MNFKDKIRYLRGSFKILMRHRRRRRLGKLSRWQQIYLFSAPARKHLNSNMLMIRSFMVINFVSLLVILFMHISSAQPQQIHRRQQQQLQPKQDNVVAEMQVVCHSDSIVLMVNTNTPFNGMLYAKDAANSPECLSEFYASTNMSLRLPLKSCGTLSAEMDDGVEFFNTIVVQPHMRLMTNQGKGYHIRCKYQTRERTIANTHFNVSAAFHAQNGPQTSMAPLLATASMPMCTMKIYRIDQDNVAESVKVGDKLVLVIEIDRQDMYGMRITNCVVRDGMNKAEQQLINDFGCPVDETIMPKFEYENNNTRAAVAFRAHKFPHTSSIYYQCNVRLCINGGSCEQVICSNNGANGTIGDSANGLLGTNSGPNNNAGGPRRKRFIGHNHRGEIQSENAPSELDASPSELPVPDKLMSNSADKQQQSGEVSFDVFSGLEVSDSDSASKVETPKDQQVSPARRSNHSIKDGGNNNNLNEYMGPINAPGPAEARVSIGTASLLVLVGSTTSVALVLLIACQAGLISANGCGDDGTNGASTRAANLGEDLDRHHLHHNQNQRVAGARLRLDHPMSAPQHSMMAGRFQTPNSRTRPSAGNAKNFAPFYQFE